MKARIPDVFTQVTEICKSDAAVSAFVGAVMLREAQDPDQCLGRFKSIYEELLVAAIEGAAGESHED
jgi:hypothetical protein